MMKNKIRHNACMDKRKQTPEYIEKFYARLKNLTEGLNGKSGSQATRNRKKNNIHGKLREEKLQKVRQNQ